MNSVRILVVEDEGAVGRDIRNTLIRCGYSVADIARTGSEALEIVRRVDPDLVIMDIRLSGAMDGIEAAERIRSSYGKPIIYLTALADEPAGRSRKATCLSPSMSVNSSRRWKLPFPGHGHGKHWKSARSSS